MIPFILSRIDSFRHAFRGFWYVLRTQRNAWIHAFATLVVVSFGLWLELNNTDWAAIVISITIVWMAEFINTSIEALVDLASPSHHPLAKVGKDVGAAAVLIASLSGVVVGLLIMGPPLWEKIKSLFSH